MNNMAQFVYELLHATKAIVFAHVLLYVSLAFKGV